MPGYTDLTRLKAALSITDTDDDARLTTIIAAVDAELIRRIGIYLGPSADTLRLFDGYRASRDRLYIPGGIRELSAVRLASSTGQALEATTLADFLLRPHAWELRAGQPYPYVQITDYPVGTWSSFPRARANVELTGSFGYAAVPDDLATMADMVAARMWNDREAGTLATPTPSKFIFGADIDTLDNYQRENFPMMTVVGG